MAFVVNSLLLILGDFCFYGHAQDVMAFEQMYNALANPHIAGLLLVNLWQLFLQSLCWRAVRIQQLRVL